jgi:8-oxo-dGTP diphosphatase
MPPMPRIRVAAVIVRDGELLLIRHQKDNQTYWLLPGGGVDFGERLDEALVREVNEETGLEIRVGRVLFLSDSIAGDKHRHMVQVAFAAEVAGGRLALGSDPRLAECRYVTFDALPEVLLYPNMNQALLAVLCGGGPSALQYLGNLWED